MPEISRFEGMIIQMYYDDHPDPHIHVKYAAKRAKIDLDGNLVAGELPLPKLHIVKRWIILHKEELLKNWNRMRKGLKPRKIEPWV